jgi:mRNA-degrading endonuclease RelE of RelBE toxin-antitoxin system
MKTFISSTFIESVKKLQKPEIKMVEAALEKFRFSRFRPSLNEEVISNGFKSARVNLDLRIIFYEHEDTLIMAYVDHHDDAYDWANNNKVSKSFAGYLYFENTKINVDELEIIKSKILPAFPPSIASCFNIVNVLFVAIFF